MSELLRNLRYYLADLKNFGPGVLARHVGRTQLTLRGVGRVMLRRGQSDMMCMRQVFAGLEYDLSTMPRVQARVDAAMKRILDLGEVPIIIDGGANIGAASIWYAQRYPEAKIVAVEPEPGNYEVLLANVRGWANVMPVNAGLGGQRGRARVNTDGLGWAAQTSRSDDGVELLTIRDCVRLVPGGHPFIVKIDIEGFESDLFATNTDWITEATVVAVEPHDWMLPGQFTSRNFMKAMAAHAFELFIVGENLIFVR
jgi:FkbM family methyltransferase